MKKLLAVTGLVTLLTLGLFTTGCHTVANGSSAPAVAVNTNGIIQVFGHDINPQDVGTSLRIAAQGGAIAALNYDKNSRAYLQAVDVILSAAVASGQYDPAALATSLSRISIKEAHDPHVASGINSALALYSTFFGSIVSAKINDASPYLVPALTGLRDGIAAGLASVPELTAQPKPILVAPSPAGQTNTP